MSIAKKMLVVVVISAGCESSSGGGIREETTPDGGGGAISPLPDGGRAPSANPDGGDDEPGGGGFEDDPYFEGDAGVEVPPANLAGLSATCVGAVSYSRATDRVYVDGPAAICTPRDVALALETLKTPVASGHGLVAIDEQAGIYYLASNLFLREGASLHVRGGAVGGDTNELRLKSLGSAEPNSFVSIRAEWGTVRFEGTRVTSWDEAASKPDTEYEMLGRAYVHVRSTLDPDGVTPHESRMDILGSEIAYLGYFKAESYGLSWKVAGMPTTASGASLFDLVNVLGEVKDSNLHHNYFGIYTFGLAGGTWSGNNVHDNVKYGIDFHDDSDGVLITENDAHDNGDHGIICSRRCDKLNIVKNVSQKNVGVGIFLHGMNTDCVVENNMVVDNTLAGIALFDSHNNVVRGNQVRGGESGVRLSVGSSSNTIEGNDLGFHSKYGFYLYKGMDVPVAGDGRNKNNTFAANTVHDTAQALLLSDSDDNTFRDNTFTNLTNWQAVMRRGLRNVIANNTWSSDKPAAIKLEGEGAESGSAIVRQAVAFTLSLKGPTQATVESSEGQVYSEEFSASTSVTSTGSSLVASNTDMAELRSTVTPLPLFIRLPAGATGTSTIVPGGWTDVKTWTVNAGVPSDMLTFRIGGLMSGTCYSVLKNGAPLSSVRAFDNGFVDLGDAPGAGSAVYTLTAAICPL